MNKMKLLGMIYMARFSYSIVCNVEGMDTREREKDKEKGEWLPPTIHPWKGRGIDGHP